MQPCFIRSTVMIVSLFQALYKHKCSFIVEQPFGSYCCLCPVVILELCLGLSQNVAQLVKALTPGVCCAESHRFEPRPTRYFLSEPFTLYCMSSLSYTAYYFSAHFNKVWRLTELRKRLLYEILV